jgi:hypothetical protein
VEALEMSNGVRHGWFLLFVYSTVVHGAEPAPTYESTVAEAVRLDKLELWSEAGDAYLRALRLRPDARDAETIALKAIQTHSSFNDLGCVWKKVDAGRDPIVIDGQLAKLFGAYDAYLTFFPSSKTAATVRYWKASHLEDCNHFHEAADLYRQVYERSPDRELAGYARAGYRRVTEDAGKPGDVRGHSPERKKAGGVRRSHG